ncbi:sensor histidine kinase [Elusimicrobiota bacterium]
MGIIAIGLSPPLPFHCPVDDLNPGIAILDVVMKSSEKRRKETSMAPAPGHGISEFQIERFPMLKAPVKWASDLLIERLSYLLVLTPLLANYVETGKLPSTPATLIADAIMGCVILAFVLLMRHTRRRVDQVNSLRKTLNEAIIHDLKNPMTSIMACISCLSDESPDARQGKLLELALHGCRSQLTLIETLVDTSRLEQGELHPQAQAIDTRQMLGTCLRNVRGTASHLGVNLKEIFPDSLPTELLGDPDLLPRVFFNLLLNALRYSPRGGDVSLSASFKDDWFQFEVKDTGIGIPPMHIKRLFKKYYRVEGPDQNTRRGSGLGLYFSRLVVEAHGGKISVESDVGCGTRIAFSIPQAPSKIGVRNDPEQGIRSVSEAGAEGRNFFGAEASVLDGH